MKTSVLLASLVAGLFAARAQAIDFVPRFADSVDDGVPFRRMYFSDKNRRVFYRPPPTWSPLGTANAVVFLPAKIEQASVRIENAPAEQVQIPLDETGLAALRKTARSLLPPDATEVVPSWETVNPVVLQGWTSFEVGYDYLSSGHRRCRSVLFINLSGGRQIHFIVAAQPADFGALYKTAYRTLATWWEREAE